jgi:hypothetical protein
MKTRIQRDMTKTNQNEQIRLIRSTNKSFIKIIRYMQQHNKLVDELSKLRTKNKKTI